MTKRYSLSMLTVAVAAGSAQAEPALWSDLESQPSRWELSVAWWNDLFADPPPYIDDSGFTNDLAARLRWPVRKGAVRLDVFHRMITEQFLPPSDDYNRLRWDQLDVTGGYSHGWARGSTVLQVSEYAGLAVGGNVGGLAIQDAWHRYSRTGATVEEGLQNNYDGGNRFGLLVGATARAEWTRGAVTPFLGANGQFAIGDTGLSRLEGSVGVRVGWPVGGVRLLATLELAAATFGTDDPNLTIHGGYNTDGVQFMPRWGLGVRTSGYEFEWSYRANEGGSREPTGIVSMSIRK